jgi:hypothetical protein
MTGKLTQIIQKFFLSETTSNKLKANNLNHFLDFENKMIFTESEQIFNIELQDQVKIIQLDNLKTVSYKNLVNHHSPEFAESKCLNYLKSGYKLVEVIDTSITEPIELYFHPQLNYNPNDFKQKQIIIPNPVIGFHMINNHAFVSLTSLEK